MIPLWKVRRELSRFKSQLLAIAEHPLQGWKTRRYDNARPQNLKTANGDLTLGTSVAVILIFQPKGIAQSTLDMLAWFKSNDITPLVVSNCPIPQEDIDAIKPLCWKVIERPNFGYDFGGYREGLMQLWEAKSSLNEVFVLNYSAWFPLDIESDFIPRLRATKADISGSILREKQPNLRWLESYFYRINGETFRHPEFRSYWDEYLLTSNKYVVIRRGERDFGVTMIERGFSLSAIFDATSLVERLKKAPATEIFKTLKYAHYVNIKWDMENASLLNTFAEDEAWKNEAIEHIQRSMEKGGFNSQFGYAAANILGFPFLKKSNDPTNNGWRKEFRNAVENDDLPKPQPEIWRELVEKQDT
jgi:hypothetical protein